MDGSVDQDGKTSLPRVIIVSEHASSRYGGEACLPWHYFRLLRRRNAEVWLVVHERTKDELVALMRDDADRMHFVPDTWFNKVTWKLSRFLPAPLAYITLGYASRLST